MKVRCGHLFDTSLGKFLENVDITVEKGKIVSVSEADNSPVDEDMSNCFVLPGFADSHTHLCFDVGDEVKQIGEAAGYQALVAAKNARKAILSGVTTLRDAGEKDYVDFSVKRGIEEGLIPGPRMIAAGPGIMRTGGHMWFMGEEADGEAEVMKGVRRQLRSGVDYIKIFVSGGATSHFTGTVTPEMTKKEIETIIYEAHTAGKKVGAHTHGGDAATWAIEAGVDAIEHGCFLTEEQLLLMKKHKTVLVLTSGIQRAIRDCETNSDFMREKAGGAYDNYLSVIKRAAELGIEMAAGTDTNHGNIAEEALFLSNAGVSFAEAVKVLTINGARLCSLDTLTGSIEAGKYADMTVFEENPTNNISVLYNPSWVFKEGKIIKTPAGIVF